MSKAPAPVTKIALPCPCGGKLDLNCHEAFSVDSSFDYAGCDKCDAALIDHDVIDDLTIDAWNRLVGSGR